MGAEQEKSPSVGNFRPVVPAAGTEKVVGEPPLFPGRKINPPASCAYRREKNSQVYCLLSGEAPLSPGRAIHDSLVAHVPAAAQGRVQGNQRAGVLVIVLGKLNLRGVEVLLGVQDFNVVGKACAVALKGEFYRRVVGFHGLGLGGGDAPQLVPLDERAGDFRQGVENRLLIVVAGRQEFRLGRFFGSRQLARLEECSSGSK